MAERTFIFHISNYDVKRLFPQLSKALEARSELLSRERYPGMWNATDTLNLRNEGKTPGTILSRGKSVVFLLLGIILLVPGLVNPQEMLVPLIFGLIGVFAGVRGLTNNSKWMLKRMKRKFDISAKQLLAGKDMLTEENFIDISFSEEGMSFPTGADETETVPYDAFESVVEAKDLYLVVFDTSVTVLQKTDLQGGDFVSFNAFLEEKINHYICCIVE